MLQGEVGDCRVRSAHPPQAAASAGSGAVVTSAGLEFVLRSARWAARPPRATRAALIAFRSPIQYPTLVAHAVAMTYCDDEEHLGRGVDLFVAGVRGLAPISPS